MHHFSKLDNMVTWWIQVALAGVIWRAMSATSVDLVENLGSEWSGPAATLPAIRDDGGMSQVVPSGHYLLLFTFHRLH